MKIEHPYDEPLMHVRKQGLKQGRWNLFGLQVKKFNCSQFLQIDKVLYN